MAKKLYEEANISAIASAIRSKNGFSSTYTVSDMASAIANIHPALSALSVSENGSYTPGTGVDGFDNVVVAVPVPVFESLNVSANSTYFPGTGVSGFSMVVVNVPTETVALDSSSFSENGTYSASTYGLDGFSQVVISVPTSAAPVLESLEVSANGTFTPGSGVDGFSQVVVSVPTDGSADLSNLQILANVNSGIFSDNQLGKIGANAFNGRTHIKGLYLGSASIIEERAFYNGGLSFVDIPECLEIGSYAFGKSGEDGTLKSVNFPKCRVFHEGAFFWNKSMKISGNILYNSECSFIGSSAFQSCHNLYCKVSLPNCTRLYKNAFYMAAVGDFSLPVCTRIDDGSTWPAYLTVTSFYAPLLEYIGADCFKGCNLTEVNFSLCTYVGNQAFYYAYSISSISLPLCTRIGTRGFAEVGTNIVGSISVYLPAVETLGDGAFSNATKIKEISLPSCKTLGPSVFDRTGISTISLPVCETVGSYAFNNTPLEYINLPSCKTLYYYAFINCKSLSYALLPMCTIVYAQAFQGCTSLTMVSLPVCSKLSGGSIFSNCNNLMSLYLLSSAMVSIGYTDIFYNTPMVNSNYTGEFGSIFVPESLVSTYQANNNWSRFSGRITAYTE